MADFSTIVNASNTSLDLYCNSIKETVNAYAILGTASAATTVTPASPQTVNWATSTDSVVYQIGQPDSGSFTLTKNGVYLIDVNITVDLPAVDGGQGQVSLIVDGTNKTYDVAFSSVTQGAQGSTKLTLKGYATKLSSNPNPVSVSVRISTLVTNMVFRYAQLSITRVG